MSLIRSLFLFIFSFMAFAYAREPINLRNYERSLWSQNGEDGVLWEIFRQLDSRKGFCVEFGASDGYWYSNTLQFRDKGWDCLLLSGDDENPQIFLYQAWVTKENVLDLFKRYNVPEEFELLSVDIDSNDWYVWRAIGKKYRPQVVVIEYNQNLGMDFDRVIVYDPNREWDGHSLYYGASLRAYELLGKKLGYTLVYCERQGINAFFIRDDVLEEKKIEFLNQGNLQKLYRGVGRIHHSLRSEPFTCAEYLLSED